MCLYLSENRTINHGGQLKFSLLGILTLPKASVPTVKQVVRSVLVAIFILWWAAVIKV